MKEDKVLWKLVYDRYNYNNGSIYYEGLCQVIGELEQREIITEEEEAHLYLIINEEGFKLKRKLWSYYGDRQTAEDFKHMLVGAYLWKPGASSYRNKWLLKQINK